MTTSKNYELHKFKHVLEIPSIICINQDIYFLGHNCYCGLEHAKEKPCIICMCILQE